MINLLRSKHFLLISLLIFGWAVSASAQPPDFVALAEQLKPAVVNIGTAKTVKPRAPMPPGPHGPGGDMFDEFVRVHPGSLGLSASGGSRARPYGR